MICMYVGIHLCSCVCYMNIYILLHTYRVDRSSPSKHLMQWSKQEVSEFIEMLGFATAAENFLSNGVDGEQLLTLTSEDLLYDLDVKKYEHRRAISDAIFYLKSKWM